MRDEVFDLMRHRLDGKDHVEDVAATDRFVGRNRLRQGNRPLHDGRREPAFLDELSTHGVLELLAVLYSTAG